MNNDFEGSFVYQKLIYVIQKVGIFRPFLNLCYTKLYNIKDLLIWSGQQLQQQKKGIYNDNKGINFIYIYLTEITFFLSTILFSSKNGGLLYGGK